MAGWGMVEWMGEASSCSWGPSVAGPETRSAESALLVVVQEEAAGSASELDGVQEASVPLLVSLEDLVSKGRGQSRCWLAMSWLANSPSAREESRCCSRFLGAFPA